MPACDTRILTLAPTIPPAAVHNGPGPGVRGDASGTRREPAADRAARWRRREDRGRQPEGRDVDPGAEPGHRLREGKITPTDVDPIEPVAPGELPVLHQQSAAAEEPADRISLGWREVISDQGADQRERQPDDVDAGVGLARGAALAVRTVARQPSAVRSEPREPGRAARRQSEFERSRKRSFSTYPRPAARGASRGHHGIRPANPSRTGPIASTSRAPPEEDVTVATPERLAENPGVG
jgi:hypothetical protein